LKQEPAYGSLERAIPIGIPSLLGEEDVNFENIYSDEMLRRKLLQGS
jgi:hypothetical protein